MHFSKTTEYAVRILSYLYRYSEEPHSAAFLHKELELPYKYLTKLMTKLEKDGFVSATRGRNGGFKLSMDAESIYLHAIVESLGDSMESQRCILGFAMCDASNPCALHHKWLKPKKAIDEMLESTTLAQLMQNEERKI